MRWWPLFPVEDRHWPALFHLKTQVGSPLYYCHLMFYPRLIGHPIFGLASLISRWRLWLFQTATGFHVHTFPYSPLLVVTYQVLDQLTCQGFVRLIVCEIRENGSVSIQQSSWGWGYPLLLRFMRLEILCTSCRWAEGFFDLLAVFIWICHFSLPITASRALIGTRVGDCDL